MDILWFVASCSSELRYPLRMFSVFSSIFEQSVPLPAFLGLLCSRRCAAFTKNGIASRCCCVHIMQVWEDGTNFTRAPFLFLRFRLVLPANRFYNFERHSQAKRAPSLFLFKFGTTAHTLPWHHLGFPIKSPLVFYHLSNMNFTSFRFDPTPIETDIPPLVLSTSIPKSPNTPQAPMYPTDVSRPTPNS